jgi:hypothetical protein
MQFSVILGGCAPVSLASGPSPHHRSRPRILSTALPFLRFYLFYEFRDEKIRKINNSYEQFVLFELVAPHVQVLLMAHVLLKSLFLRTHFLHCI